MLPMHPPESKSKAYLSSIYPSKFNQHIKRLRDS